MDSSVIKYSIVSLFYQKEQQQYYTQENVGKFIFQNFGIEIPSLVLRKSIVAISNKSTDIELEIYDKGAEFKILRAWDFSINADIDAKAHFFDTNIGKLEQEYREYIKSEGIESDKTFLDFISDNTDDILGYFENESIEKIDSEYATMAYFLKHLQTTMPELFKIASELFWGSIIAGFLKRENVPSISGGGNSIEYFLDTPIVMGLLNLSTSENEKLSKSLDNFSFCKGRKGKSRMRTIGASKIILELWMHNTKQSGIENNALTEMMARCMDMNDRDVRNKLGIVSRYYNSTKRDDYDPKVFQKIVRCLYKRDKEVIAAVEGLRDEVGVNIDVNMRIIVEKAHQSSMENAERVSDIQRQMEDLRRRLKETEEEKAAA